MMGEYKPDETPAEDESTAEQQRRATERAEKERDEEHKRKGQHGTTEGGTAYVSREDAPDA